MHLNVIIIKSLGISKRAESFMIMITGRIDIEKPSASRTIGYSDTISLILKCTEEFITKEEERSD